MMTHAATGMARSVSRVDPMIVAAIASVVLAVGLCIAWVLTARRLRAERTARAAADIAAAEQAALLSAEAESERGARAEAEEQRAVADRRSAEAEAQRSQADQQRDAAEAAAAAALERADLADERSTRVFAGFDPELIWQLEQARSERLWRLSIALGPDLDSVFLDDPQPLRVALQVEVDATREEVGAVVELDAELPPDLTPAGSVLVLRSAQELLATVVRRSEDTTVRIRPDGRDILVTIHSRDEHGEPVAPGPLPIAASSTLEPIDDGVRIRNVVAGT